MAKRFGRNQRRKLLEEVYRAQHLAAMAERDKALEYQRRRRLEGMIEAWNGRIRDKLGQYSGFLSEPGQIYVEHLLNRLPKTMTMATLMALPGPEAVIENMDRITLDLFRVLESEDMINLSTDIKFIQITGGGERVLATRRLDNRVIYEAEPEVIAHFVSQEMATYLKLVQGKA